MEKEDLDILSARISALTIISSQILALYLIDATEPFNLTERLKESAESILEKMRPEIQDEGKKLMSWIFVEARRAAHQID